MYRIHLNKLTIINVGIAILIVFLLTDGFSNLSSSFFKKEVSLAANDPQIQTKAQSIHTECQRRGQECYEEKLKSVVYDYSFSTSENVLYTLQDLNPYLRSCHVIAHALANEGVKKNPKKWETMLDTINVNTCGSGFLHGVLEAHLGKDPNTVFNSQLSDETCIRGDDHYRIRMCTHFMGHFFLIEHNNNFEEAVPNCRGVREDMVYDCFDGLFMEKHQKIALVDHGLSDPPLYTETYTKELEEHCLKFNSVAAVACWTEMAEVYAKTFGYDAKIIYDKCSIAPTKQTRERCYGKGITIMVTYPMELTDEQLVSICQPVSGINIYESCTSNMMSTLMHYSPKYTSRGIKFCSNAAEDRKDWCFTQLGNKLAEFVPSAADREIYCAEAKENYFNLCAKIN